MRIDLSAIPVDEDLFRAERAADAGVMASLARNGDHPRILRKVDLRFLGAEAALQALARAAADLDLTVIQLVEAGKAGHALDLFCQSDTRVESIDALTRRALQIGSHFGVTYDGWGTLAQRG